MAVYRPDQNDPIPLLVMLQTGRSSGSVAYSRSRPAIGHWTADHG
jgi:hypothetical protein